MYSVTHCERDYDGTMLFVVVDTQSNWTSELLEYDEAIDIALSLNGEH